MMDRRIVFMGTPDFAVASLRALVDAGIDVAAVITAPDRPAGRGRQMHMSAVKEFALSHPLLKDRILQPERLKDPDFHRKLNATGASLYVVVAFRMLPGTVWNRPALGTINLHASLLPDYRGAAPINWAIINGEERTGATMFFVRHEIDSGDVIAKEGIAIGPEENAGELHDRLKEVGASLLVRTVHDILSGKSQRVQQDNIAASQLHHAPKLTTETCRIDVSANAQRVHDRVRGLGPFPGAWTMWNETGKEPQHFKILRSRVIDDHTVAQAGLITIDGERLILQCGTGRIDLLEIQPEGKRRMDAASFVRGLRNTEGITLA